MKSFRFKYSPIVWVLLGLVIAIFLTGLGFNIFNIAVTKEQGFKLVSYWIMAGVTGLVLLLAISVAIFGKYVIKKGYVYSYFGIVSSKIAIEDIVEIVHFKKSNSLVAYFSDNNFSVIVIAPELFDEFVLSVRKEKPSIKFDIKIEDENLKK